MRVSCLLVAVTFLLTLSGAGTRALAGGYISPSVKWSAFAARPKEAEATPNYYAYGAGLSLGYSVRQVLDFGLFGNYLPGSLQQAKFGKGPASLVSYGGELGLRLADAIFIGIRGGLSRYKLDKATLDTEVTGQWAGTSGGLALGMVSKLTKQSYIQTTLEVMQHSLTSKDEPSDKRRFDSFSLSLAYLFNSLGGSSAIDNTIFKDFLNSIIF